MSNDSSIERRLKAVVFTDIVGFSALTQKNEPEALNAVQIYRDIVTGCTADYHGELVNFYGDGSLSMHDSTYEAVQCAVDMQRRFTKGSVPVRIGIHLGEIVRSDDTVYGNAVNIASRIQDLASSRSILVSGAVEDQLINHEDISLTYVGKESVKNISEPIEVYAVNSPGLAIPTKSEIHKRNKARRPSTYWIAALTILVAAAAVVLDSFDISIFPKPLSQKRILVEIPFVNNTGNSDYDDLTRTSPEYISTCLTSVDKLKLVNLGTYYDQNLDKFGALPLKSLSSATNAEVFIQGTLITNDTGGLILNCQIVDRNYKVLESFPDHALRPGHTLIDLNKMASRIAGYILSSDLPITTPPTQDAFEAYQEAMHLWGENDYEDSRKFLIRAIGHDSTFLDAWYLLIDSYYNMAEFEIADSLLTRVSEVVEVDRMSDKQVNDFYYFQALLDYDHMESYTHLRAKYDRNKSDPFLNSTTAGYAMFFLNAPREALSILRKVRRADIDYTINSDIYRLKTGIQAYTSLGKFKKAANLAARYPESEIELEHRLMQLRAYIGKPDTNAVNDIITTTRLNKSSDEYLSVLYWCAREYILHGDSIRGVHFLNACTRQIEEQGLFSYDTPYIEYLKGNFEVGLEHAVSVYEYYPNWSFTVGAVGLGYALLNERDSAMKYSTLLNHPDQITQFPGQGSYEQARIYAQLGDINTAVLQVSDAIHNGTTFEIDRFNNDPFLMPLFTSRDYRSITHPLTN